MLARGAGTLIKDAIFVRIWGAIFLSAAGTFLLLMTLSAHVLEILHSIPHANAVVLTQWIPAIVALPLIKRLATDFAGKPALLVAEVGCVAFTVLALFFTEQYFPLLVVLLLRGAFDSLSKVARTTALRQYFTGERLDRAASYYNTALLIGGGVGSFLGLLLYDTWGVTAVAGLCAGLHAGAVLIYLSLPSGAAEPSQSVDMLAAQRPLVSPAAIRRASIYFVACVSLFQGFHNFARTAYPIAHLGLDESTISLVQMITNAAYVTGALVAARIVLSRDYPKIAAATQIATALALLSLPLFSSPWAGLGMYAIFGILFEVGFCVHLRYVITNVPKHLVGSHVANINAWSMALMVTVAYGGSVLHSYIGFELTAVIIAILGMSTVPIMHIISNTRDSNNIRKTIEE
jgi:predicted MFS family arabinose efflux permease